MGGPIVAVKGAQAEPNFKNIPNNAHKSWWRDPGLRMNMLHCIGLCGTLFFNGYDGSLVNGLQSIDAWQEYFHHPTSNILGLMTSAGFLPGLIVCWLADVLSSYYGRRITVWLGSAFALIGALIISLSTSSGMFIAGRAVMGIGVQGSLTIAPSMLQEIAHPRYRARISGFYMTIYYLAAIISAGVCRGTLSLAGEKSWRIPCFLQLVGPVATLLMTSNIPESPRWLVKKGKESKAREVLTRYHANGQVGDALVEYEFHEIVVALQHEQLNNQTKYTDYFKGSGNRRRLFIILIVSLGTNWVGNGIISYYFSPILNTLGVTSTNTQLDILIALQVWNLLVSSGSALIVDKAGRRPLWMISTIGMLASFCIVTGLSASYASHTQKAVGTAVIPFIFIFFGFYDLAWTPLSYSYPVEILTFSMRTKGQAIFVFMQTLGMSLNTWVNPIALDAIGWKYYTVYIGILVILVFLIYFIFPETKNLTIEEIAVIFDGERAIGMQDQDKIEDGPQKEDIKPTTVSPSYEHVDAVQK